MPPRYDKYNLVALLAAVVGQAIIDAYNGSRKNKKSALSFFKSETYKNIVIPLFRNYNVKFSKMFPGCPGTFETIGELIENGNAEILYRCCSVVPILLGYNKDDWGLIRGKLQLITMRKTQNIDPIQIAL